MAAVISKEDKENVIKSLAYSLAENFIKSNPNNSFEKETAYQAYKIYENAYKYAMQSLHKEEIEEEKQAWNSFEKESFHR